MFLILQLFNISMWSYLHLLSLVSLVMSEGWVIISSGSPADGSGEVQWDSGAWSGFCDAGWACHVSFSSSVFFCLELSFAGSSFQLESCESSCLSRVCDSAVFRALWGPWSFLVLSSLPVLLFFFSSFMSATDQILIFFFHSDRCFSY